MKAWLENESEQAVPVNGLCSLGRTPGNTVVIPLPKVSRKHAMIHEQEGEYWMVDLGSTNGVEINGKRVTHPTKLRNGDQFQMSTATFIFRQQAESEGLDGVHPTKRDTQYDMTLPDLRTVECWILIADIQGFTKLSQQLTPEELAPRVGKWVDQCQVILHEQSGTLIKFLGDGFLAYWRANKDAASFVALACRKFQELQKSHPLAFRMAVHYGPVALGGRCPDASDSMIGPEMNFSFRLEQVASRLKIPWIFSDAAAHRLESHLPLSSCGSQTIRDFESDRRCFTLG